MNNSAETFKQHMFDYYLFYALAYFLVLPAWMHLKVSFLYKELDMALLLNAFDLGIVLVIGAGIIKHKFPKLKKLSFILLSSGIIVQFACLFKLYSFIKPFGHIGVIITLLNVLVSFWWLIIYFSELTDFANNKNKLIGKKVLKYYVLCAVILYGSDAMINKLFKSQIVTILNEPHELDNAKIEIILASKMLQANITVSFLIIIVLILFFVFYRHEINRLSNR